MSAPFGTRIASLDLKMTSRDASRWLLPALYWRVKHGLFSALLLSSSLWGVAGCASTVKQAAKEAAPAAVDEAAEEASDPRTRDNLAQVLADPEIQKATAGLAEAIVGGALAGLTEKERAAELQRLTDAFVTTVGAALARSLQNDIGPQLSATFADAVDRSLARALDTHTEERLQALAVAVTRAAMQSLGEGMIDPTTGQAAPLMAHTMGQFAREVTRQGAFGLEDAVRQAELGHDISGPGPDRRGGGVLAAAGRVSDLALAFPPLLLAGLILSMFAGCLALGWALWRLQHHRQLSRAHEDAALALARAIKATENAAWSEELRRHIARATQHDAGGAQLRKLLREHAELRLNPRPRDVAPGSDHSAH